MSKNVLYTTIYPGVEQFLSDWYDSVLSQDTSDFDLYIGLDKIAKNIVPDSITDKYRVTFIEAGKEDTPITLRNMAMEQMTKRYDAIVFTDSDDLLESTRISSALSELNQADINGCALGLVDGGGNDLDVYFGLTEDEDPDVVLPRYNFLGLSNSAWRADALRACIPAPPECIAMDWFLSTSGWCRGLRISFDRKIKMRYRQYGANTACVVPLFTPEQIIKATNIVCTHYRLMEKNVPVPARKRAILEDAAARVNLFKTNIDSSRLMLEAYVTALNQMPALRLWWLTVAHPQLEDIWNC